MDAALRVELWTSWASMLRVYAAAHGLNSPHHAVVEVGTDAITLRVDRRSTRFTHDFQVNSEGAALPFSLNADGTVLLGDCTDELDMAAERVVGELFRS